jgi:uncharacterized membrane protein
MLGQVVSGLLAGLAVVPGAIMLVIFLLLASRGGGHPAIGLPVVLGGVLALAGLCVTVYLQICWKFTLYLIADKKMSFWPAMDLSRAVVRKHWGQTFLLAVVSGALILLGLICCLIGAIITGPIAFAMWIYAYERLFGDMQPAAD